MAGRGLSIDATLAFSVRDSPVNDPGADLSNEELTFRVVPRQADEFTCARCFLVHHHSQLAGERKGEMICRECVA